MSGQPDTSQAMVLCWVRVEQRRNTDLAAARDDCNDLQNARKRLAGALGEAQLLLMEVEEYQLAANAGLLATKLSQADPEETIPPVDCNADLVDKIFLPLSQ